MQKLEYRKDIDGLRAIAVLSVVLFHAGIPFFDGGFVGVDIFFVISGYLISTIIISDINNKSFSILKFYERRIRRLIPALFFMMLFCLPFAWFLLLPSKLLSFGESLIAVNTYTSNIYFMFENGYFNKANESTPLLHTWSLAVEEQFYFLFPLCFLFFNKYFKKNTLYFILLAFVVSLSISIWGVYHYSNAAYFLLPTRAYEILLGTITAFLLLYSEKTKQIITHETYKGILSFLGLLMILFPVFCYNEATPFPSYYALVPCLGTSLIIMFGRDTFIDRFLSLKPLVFIGLISYSLYLWHQPVLAFSKSSIFYEYAFENIYFQTLLILLSVLLSYMSWKYVESPFRDRKRITTKKVIILFLSLSSIFICVGLTTIYNYGFQNRKMHNGETLQVLENKVRGNYGLDMECDTEEFILSKKCRTHDKPDIVLWGDSFAMHLAGALTTSNPDIKMIQFTFSGCPPIFNISPYRIGLIKFSKQCIEFNDKFRAWLKQNPNKYVVLASPFYQITNQAKYKLRTRNGKLLPINEETSKLYLEATINELKKIGAKPVIVSPPPNSGKKTGICLVKQKQFNGNLKKCNFKISDLSKDRRDVYNLLNSLDASIKIIKLNKFMCNNLICNTYVENKFIYIDAIGHFSYEGSRLLGSEYNLYKMITE